MRSKPGEPTLRIVEGGTPRQRREQPIAPKEAAAASLLERMIAAAAPGDFEAILIGIVLGILLVAGLVVSADLDVIMGWLRG